MDTNTRAGSVLRLVGVWSVLSLLTACQPSLEDVIADHREAVEGVFARLKALDDPVRDAPPLTTDGMAIGAERVVLEGDGSNALFIRAVDLQAPESASSDGMGATRAAAVETCGELLRGEFSGVAKGAALYLSQCGRAEYAFVLRTTTEEPATLIDDKSFSPGVYEGELLLFRLADSALLGGFRVSARSSDQVQVAVDSSGQAQDAIDRLNSDLSSKVFVDIDARLRANVAGVIP